jgi:hypothetical protein
MVRRNAALPSSDELPPELAAGPDHPSWQPHGRLGTELVSAEEDREQRARKSWFRAGRDWSRTHGHDWNGWQNLLTPEVRHRTSTRYRLERMGALSSPPRSTPMRDVDLPTPDPEPPARDAPRAPKPPKGAPTHPPRRPDPPPSASFFGPRF